MTEPFPYTTYTHSHPVTFEGAWAVFALRFAAVRETVCPQRVAAVVSGANDWCVDIPSVIDESIGARDFWVLSEEFVLPDRVLAQMYSQTIFLSLHLSQRSIFMLAHWG